MNSKGLFSYSGNKYIIYSKYLKDVIVKYNKVYEPFCGSGVCLYNSNKGGLGIDIDSNIILLHKSLYDLDLLDKINDAYMYFFPAGRTKEGYNNLRKTFNASWIKTGTTLENVHFLHILIQLSFNSLLRFGKTGFNAAFGRKGVDFNRIEQHQNIVLDKNINFLQGDYSILDLSLIDKEKDLIYFDPPYLASKHVYKGWQIEDEVKLLEYLTDINKKGYKFILSNTFLHKGVTNNELVKWSKDFNVMFVKMFYNSWVAGVEGVEIEKNTVEVLISNFLLSKTKPLF